jgi:hypothetical protein
LPVQPESACGKNACQTVAVTPQIETCVICQDQ